jgi:hypothetical protein
MIIIITCIVLCYHTTVVFYQAAFLELFLVRGFNVLLHHGKLKLRASYWEFRYIYKFNRFRNS